MTLLCRMLKVSKSAYYGALHAVPSKRQMRREEIAGEVERFHSRSRGIYGYRKVAEDIRAETEISCCADTVRRIMREKRLCAKARHKFVVTTQSRHSLPVADNLLERDFLGVEPNRKWVTDITYIRTAEGWLYLAGVLDLYSRRIVGWSMSERIDSDLACSALNMAIQTRKPEAGLLHHSDRGVQYAAAYVGSSPW